jgi:uncharacterized protein
MNADADRIHFARELGLPASPPTPLPMIVTLADHVILTDLERRANEQALEPKNLVTIDGGHFDPYLGQDTAASAAAVSWFHQHLRQDQ